ncbi:MAG TPA: hypothetical protein VLG44_02160 [Chlamydiales bacterium]|nr:hypothetical protein [Chlamydiales bacterium]
MVSACLTSSLSPAIACQASAPSSSASSPLMSTTVSTECKASAPSSTSRSPFYADILFHVSIFLPYSWLCNFSATHKNAWQIRNANHYQLDRRIFASLTIFDAMRYKKEWQVDIIANISDRGIREFLNVYFGENDPLGRPGKVRDYCLIPTIVPEKVIDFRFTKDPVDFSLEILDQLAQRSITHPAKICYRQRVDPHRTAPAGRARIVIKINKLIAVGEELYKQMDALPSLPTGWRIPPGLLSQTAVLFAEHAVGTYCFGGEHYLDGEPVDLIAGVTKEKVTQVVAEHYSSNFATLSGFFKKVNNGASPSELTVGIEHYFQKKDKGIGVQREFY